MVTFENPFILHLKTPKPYQTGCDVRLADVQTTGGRKELEQLRNVVLVGFFVLEEEGVRVQSVVEGFGFRMRVIRLSAAEAD